MAMLALHSHIRDIDGLIGEVETCSKLLVWPTQEQSGKDKSKQKKRKGKRLGTDTDKRQMNYTVLCVPHYNIKWIENASNSTLT